MTLIDARERELALDIGSSFIVQAPAGSGKTGVLTQRILKLLALVERPEQILAITFTKKAAAEMRNRVAEALHKAAHEPEPEQDYDKVFYRLARAVLERNREKNWGLTENLGRLRLQTIDSLCSSIVKDNPLVSGLGVQFGVEDDASELYNEASRCLLSTLGESSPVGEALYRVLGKLDNHYSNLNKLIVAMLEQRDHWLRDVTETHEDWDRFRDLLQRSLARINEEAEQKLLELLTPNQQQAFADVTQYAMNQLKLAGKDHPVLQQEAGTLAFRKALYTLLLTSSFTLRAKLDKNCGFPPASAFSNPEEKRQAEDYKQQAKSLLDSLEAQPKILPAMLDFITAPAAELSREQWQLLSDLVIVVRYAAAHLKLVFQERKALDFSEVALATLQTLGNPDHPGDAMLAMDERIQHILVDEFQDTSFIQVDLLEKLTAGWTEGDGRTLFLVGDPMQSIYAFRKADVGLFLRLWHQRQLGTIPLQPLKLAMNFRSSPAVLDWVNQTFREAFPDEDDVRAGAVCYSDSTAGKSVNPTDGTAIHIFTGEDSAANANAEADWIARQILALEGNPSIAILVKGKSHILAIASALRQQSISFQAVEIEKLTESQIIQDLLTLYRVYLSAGDKTAWFALLRGPWCGLTLAQLQQVADADPHPWRALSRLCTTPAELPVDLAEKLLAIQERMATAYACRYQQPLVETLRHLALDLGIAATAQSAADVEAMELFFAMLSRLDTVSGIPEPDLITRQLQKLFVPPDTLPTSGPVVQVMTMHKSKGLEFDVVILPQLQRKGRADDKPLILIDKQTAVLEEQQELFMAPFTTAEDDKTGSVFDYLWKIRQQRNRNEAARLLYVACTRARTKLYLTACLKQKHDKLEKPANGSLLSVIWPIVETECEYHTVETKEALAVAPTWRRPRQFQIYTQPATQLGQGTTTPDPDTEENDAIPDTQDQYRRQAGILVHSLLESWVVHPERITDVITPGQRSQWRQMLSMSGVTSDRLDAAIAIVETAVTRMVQNQERLAWLFRAPHADSHGEYRISTRQEGEVRHLSLDRTFVQDGVRYIIDYKLSEPSGDLATFLAQEKQHYLPQLQGYRQALAGREKLPCRTYLYFPLIDHLLEVEE